MKKLPLSILCFFSIVLELVVVGLTECAHIAIIDLNLIEEIPVCLENQILTDTLELKPTDIKGNIHSIYFNVKR